MNPVVHFEIPAKSIKRANEFYKQAFGWQLEQYQPDYVMAQTTASSDQGMPTQPGAINGALMEDNSVSYPIIVVSVENIDEAVKKIEGLGGKLYMQKAEVLDMGFYARVKDTEGNVIGLWQNKNP